MGWTVRGSNAGGAAILRTCPNWPWGPPSLLCNGYRVFPAIKAAGRDVNHLSYPAPRFKKKYSYISKPHLGLRGLFWGKFYFYCKTDNIFKAIPRV